MGKLFDSDEDRKARRKTKGHIILGFLITSITCVFKALIWFFNFHSVNKRLGTIKVILIIVIFGSTTLCVYKIPAVYDLLTLSKKHTQNINTYGKPFIFPDRSYFVQGEKRRSFQLEGESYFNFFAYDGSGKVFGIDSLCSLVPRGEGVIVYSLKMPVLAIGFTDDILINTERSMILTVRTKQWIEYALHSSYSLFGKGDFTQSPVTYTKKSTWKELDGEWQTIFNSRDGLKSFFIQADPNEHALICF